jgi:hypothetical protein
VGLGVPLSLRSLSVLHVAVHFPLTNWNEKFKIVLKGVEAVVSLNNLQQATSEQSTSFCSNTNCSNTKREREIVVTNEIFCSEEQRLFN